MTKYYTIGDVLLKIENNVVYEWHIQFDWFKSILGKESILRYGKEMDPKESDHPAFVKGQF